jgi:uncharacterized protein (TIGR02145 family)
MEIAMMRSNFSKIVLAAGFGFAIAFTFSCSGGEDPVGGEPSSGSVVAISSSSDGVVGNPSSSSGGGGTGTSGTFPDGRDGKSYKWVKIGEQYWMAENLNHNATGSKCYDNLESNCTTYGRLYNWATAVDACPSGWHLPSDAEWTALTDFVGGSSTAGTKLKANSVLWSTNTGTDEFGFSALPGGYGYSNGDFNYAGYGGYWWSATEHGASDAYYRYMGYYCADVYRFNDSKTGLFSVRCVQD